MNNGQVTASLLDGGPPRTVPDGTVINPGDMSGSAHAALTKDGGAHWLWNAWAAIDGRKLDINDLGYADRANQYGAGASLIFRTLEPWAHTLETITKLEGVALDNIDGLPTTRAATLATHFKLANFWTIEAGVGAQGPRFDDREVGNGAALERAATRGVELNLESDPRARLSVRLLLGVELVSSGGTVRSELAVTLHALPRLDLVLIPEGLYAHGEPRFAGITPDGNYLFGRLDAKSLGAVFRATYTFTPRLTLQSYAQLFLASRHYSDFSFFPTYLAGPHPIVHLGDLQYGAAGPAINPDTQEAALNANVVLRWEFRPGSLLYLVYTRAQAPQLMLTPREIGHLDLRSVRRAPAADVVLCKLSFWWG